MKPGQQTLAQATDQMVGFFGCWRIDRPVRVGLRRGCTVKRQKSVEVGCPCGQSHRVQLYWRELNEGEQREAEVIVEGEASV